MKSVPGLQGDGLVAGLEFPGLRHLGVDADDLEGLEPLAVRAAGLVAEGLQAGGQVGLGELVAPAAGAPPFQQVVRKEADGPFERAAVNGLGGLLGSFRKVELRHLGPREHGRDEEQQESPGQHPSSSLSLSHFHKSQTSLGRCFAGEDCNKMKVSPVPPRPPSPSPWPSPIALPPPGRGNVVGAILLFSLFSRWRGVRWEKRVGVMRAPLAAPPRGTLWFRGA